MVAFAVKFAAMASSLFLSCLLFLEKLNGSSACCHFYDGKAIA
jgi:hypothetical protein